MIHGISKYALAAAIAAAVALPTLFAADSALAISRGVKQPDGMVCRMLFGKVHYHYGRNHRAASSRSAALAIAVKRWSGFTRFEYGSRWGNWRIARKKTVNCTTNYGGWKCRIKGQPCRH